MWRERLCPSRPEAERHAAAAAWSGGARSSSRREQRKRQGSSSDPAGGRGVPSAASRVRAAGPEERERRKQSRQSSRARRAPAGVCGAAAVTHGAELLTFVAQNVVFSASKAFSSFFKTEAQYLLAYPHRIPGALASISLLCRGHCTILPGTSCGAGRASLHQQPWGTKARERPPPGGISQGARWGLGQVQAANCCNRASRRNPSSCLQWNIFSAGRKHNTHSQKISAEMRMPNPR